MSVGTFEARFGHAIHRPASGSIAARSLRHPPLELGPLGVEGDDHVGLPPQAPADAHAVRQLPSVASSKCSGADSSSTRCPGLIPSFFGSGVPL